MNVHNMMSAEKSWEIVKKYSQIIQKTSLSKEVTTNKGHETQSQ